MRQQVLLPSKRLGWGSEVTNSDSPDSLCPESAPIDADAGGIADYRWFIRHSIACRSMLFPMCPPVQVKIIVKAPGMTPEEIEARITAPLEIELLGIPRQTMLRSIAKYALTDITIDFSEGTDIYWARQQIAERLNAIWEELPDSIQGGIAPMTTPLGEMYMFTIESDQHDLIQRRNLLDWVIRPALRTVPGVADVNALGGLVRSFEVIPDTSRMAARHIAIQQLVAALQNNNRNDGAGRLDIGGEALLVRAQGRIQTLDDVRRIVVDQHQGMPVTVGDIATIQIGALTRYGAVSIDGQGETVEGLVLSLRGANARQTVLDVEEKLKDIEKALPEGVRINTFYNRGELVSRAVSTVAKALVEAIVLVMILLVLFLGNLRAALTVALTLPLAALFTFILMKTADMSANLMSLGGLAIAIGMLVDAAVVVVENVTSQLAQHSKSNHLPRLHLIYRGTKQVAVPVTSGILIIIIVFIPLLTLQGLEGKLFSPVAQTIVFALGGSLLLSLTVIPVLSSYLIREVAHDEPWLPRTLQKLYVPALSWSLAHGRLVVIIAILLLLITIPVYLSIGSIFIPTLDEGDIVLQTEKLPSINLEQSVQLDINIQRTILDQVPEVQSIVTRVGSDEIGLDPMSLNDADNFLVLKPRTEWRMQSKEQLLDAIRQCIQGIPGVSFGFTQPIEMRVSEMLTGVRGDLAVKLFGDEMTVLNRKAGEIKRVLQQIEGASDVFTSENEGMQYLQIHIDHLAAGRFGLSSDRIEQMLRSHIEGLQLGIVQEGKQRTPLILRGSINSADINTLLLALPEGRGNIALSSVARIERVEGLVSIARGTCAAVCSRAQ